MPHTPTPWTCKPFLTPREDEDPMMVYIVEAGDLQVRHDNCCPIDEATEQQLAAIHEENRANAEFIELACNAHDDLLYACLQAQAALGDRIRLSDIPGVTADEEVEVYETLKSAIAKAEGKGVSA